MKVFGLYTSLFVLMVYFEMSKPVIALEVYKTLTGTVKTQFKGKYMDIEHRFYLQVGNWCQADLYVKAELHGTNGKRISRFLYAQKDYQLLQGSHFNSISKGLSKQCASKGVEVERVHFSFYIINQSQSKLSQLISYENGFLGFSKTNQAKKNQAEFTEVAIAPGEVMRLTLNKPVEKGYIWRQVRFFCPTIRRWADALKDKGVDSSVKPQGQSKLISYRLFSPEIFTQYFTVDFASASQQQQRNFNSYINLCTRHGRRSDSKIDGKVVLPMSYNHLNLSTDRANKLEVANGRQLDNQLFELLSKEESADLSNLISDLLALNESHFWADEWKKISSVVENKAGIVLDRLFKEQVGSISAQINSPFKLQGFQQLQDELTRLTELNVVDVKVNVHGLLQQSHESSAKQYFSELIAKGQQVPNTPDGLLESKTLSTLFNGSIDYYRSYSFYTPYISQFKTVRIAHLLNNADLILEQFDSAQTRKALVKVQSKYLLETELSDPKLTLFEEAFENKNNQIAKEQREREIQNYLTTYYTPFEIESLREGAVFKAQGQVPAPDENTIFRVMFRTINNNFKSLGFTHEITGPRTISMPAKVFGLQFRIDYIINQLKVKRCNRVSTSSYKCVYDLAFYTSPEFEDAFFGSHLENPIFKGLVSGIGSIYRIGRETNHTHVFTFGKNGWQSNDLKQFFARDNERMNKISEAWRSSRPKYKTCQTYKGIEISCW